jgi:hypothetical protein
MRFIRQAQVTPQFGPSYTPTVQNLCLKILKNILLQINKNYLYQNELRCTPFFRQNLLLLIMLNGGGELCIQS